MKEEWRPVSGYEGFYEVSNLGNVRNLAVYSYKYKRVLVRKQPRLLKLCPTHEGYLRVVLSKFGMKQHFAVHRLVALTFIPNDSNLPEVNHIDENHQNNMVSNLEWCTRKYNAYYGTLPQRISDRMSLSHPKAKAVYQYKEDGTFITAFPSLKAASRAIGLHDSIIGKVCKGKAKTAGGFIFKYAV